MDRLDAWLRHLALCAQPPAGVTPVTTWIGADEQFRLGPVDDARDQLHTLVGLFEQGLRTPLYFFPRTSWALVEANGKIASAVTSKWRSFGRWQGGESEDASVRLALRGLPDPLGEEGSSRLQAVAQAVFGPLHRALNGGGAA
jgi:exodeoxyribonuclease V gamma subunit